MYTEADDKNLNLHIERTGTFIITVDELLGLLGNSEYIEDVIANQWSADGNLNTGYYVDSVCPYETTVDGKLIKIRFDLVETRS